MADALVVNASPLIFLAAARRLDLLGSDGAPVSVPRSVAIEVRRYGPDDPAARALREVPWLKVVEDGPLVPSILAWDLGPGESSVIACALARAGSIAVLDDLGGRRCARAHRLRVKGTLGLVIDASEPARFRARAPSSRRCARPGCT
jgi:predicted nucleic acid-binding protein